MRLETQKIVIDRLVKAIQEPRTAYAARSTHLSTDRYTDPTALKREQERMFRRQPVIVAHVSELADPRQYVTATVGDVPLIILRDDAGEVQVLVNACRHRGARLVDGAGGTCKRLLVCPYHAWSYRLDGSLAGVPHEDAFDDLDRSAHHLRQVSHAVRHGFVWVVVDDAADVTLDMATQLGPVLDDDFDAFDLAGHYVARTVTTIKKANWKLVMDAFAEGYHLKSLHKDSLARFFLDTSIVDDCSPHVRQVGARKSLLDLANNADGARTGWDFRRDTTVFYNVFPNAVLVFHPFWVSQMSLFPEGPDQVRVVHRMLAPRQPEDDLTRERLEKSFDHIHNEVFEKEDLTIAESIQSTLASGVNTHVILGGFEEGMRLFHAARGRALVDEPPQEGDCT